MTLWYLTLNSARLTNPSQLPPNGILQSLLDGDVRLFVSVEARDSAINSTVHDIKDYRSHHVRFGMRYGDAVTLDADGRTMADLTRISVIEPDGIEMVGETPELRAVQ